MTDLNEVKAGEYELVCALWDQPVNKPGEPFDFVRHRAGAIVTLDGPEAKRLFSAGAIVVPGSREKAQAEALRAQLEAALAALPDSVREEVLATQRGGNVDGAPIGAVEEGPAGEPVQPPKAASKEDWVVYAVARGWDQGAAEALTKKELIARLLDPEPSTTDGLVPADDDVVEADADADPVVADAPADGDLPPLPPHTAAEELWVDAAVARGIERDEAEKLNRQELINLLT